MSAGKMELETGKETEQKRLDENEEGVEEEGEGQRSVREKKMGADEIVEGRAGRHVVQVESPSASDRSTSTLVKSKGVRLVGKGNLGTWTDRGGVPGHIGLQGWTDQPEAGAINCSVLFTLSQDRKPWGCSRICPVELWKRLGLLPGDDLRGNHRADLGDSPRPGTSHGNPRVPRS
eukprot:3938910-Rhodomonas_salina.6